MDFAIKCIYITVREMYGIFGNEINFKTIVVIIPNKVCDYVFI